MGTITNVDYLDKKCKRFNLKLHHLYHLSRDKYWK